MNSPNTTCGKGDTKNFCITDLSSYIDRPDITDVPVLPENKIYLGFNNYRQKLDDVFGKKQHGHFMSKLSISVSFNDKFKIINVRLFFELSNRFEQ